MEQISRNPEEIIEGVVNGLSEFRDSGRNVGDGSESGGFPIAPLNPFGCSVERGNFTLQNRRGFDTII